ncbi:uncharacterized protein LOC113292929 [Papaver somniferum]|uniref:uncharacterized protein LOC113292929 n=1 Tax=Papaver somniferum TaxID=3469 RepID=UPI000E6F5C59|nr:uncharacterized protein LOC113292929 [Papaver somniferum]
MFSSELTSFIAFWNLTKRVETEESFDISPKEYAYAPSHYQEPSECVNNDWNYSHRYDHSGPYEGYDHYQPYPGYEPQFVDSNYYSHISPSQYERDDQSYCDPSASQLSLLERLNIDIVEQTKVNELFFAELSKTQAYIAELAEQTDLLIAQLTQSVEDRGLTEDKSYKFSYTLDIYDETALTNESICMENDDELDSCDHRNRDIVIPSEGGVFSPTPDRVNDHSPIQKDEFRIEDTILLDSVTYQCYNNDVYEECVNSEETVVKSNDLETLHFIYKVTSNHLYCDIPIDSLVDDDYDDDLVQCHKPNGEVNIPRIVSTTFQKILDFGLELRASPVLLDYFSSRDFSLPVHDSQIVSVPIPSEPFDSVIFDQNDTSFAKTRFGGDSFLLIVSISLRRYNKDLRLSLVVYILFWVDPQIFRLLVYGDPLFIFQ